MALIRILVEFQKVRRQQDHNEQYRYRYSETTVFTYLEVELVWAQV